MELYRRVMSANVREYVGVDGEPRIGHGAEEVDEELGEEQANGVGGEDKGMNVRLLNRRAIPGQDNRVHADESI